MSTFASLTSGRLKRGVLDILPFLPLDILCEIFSCLHPFDLLVLARTSKAFRNFLLNKSAAFIWRSARRNMVGLPEPLSDMSEVQYASLAFGSTCYYQGCDRKARDTIWHLRIRSCVGCRPKHQPIKVSECHDYLDLCSMLACCPEILKQYVLCGPVLNSKGNTVKGFQEQHIKSFADGLRAFPPSERQAYLDSCRQATEVTNQFASACVAWQLRMKNTRIAELRDKRAARAEIIRGHLAATSFAEEINYFGWDRIRKHSLINNIQPMTDRACSGVLEQLREYMLGWRELRMEEQVYGFRRRAFVDAWLQFTMVTFHNTSSGCPYLPLPPAATIGFLKGIDSVVRQSGSTTHELLLEQLHAAFLPAREYIPEWHKIIRRELASLLPGHKGEDDDATIHAQLKLATSVFHCTAGRGCRGEGRTLSYPEILFHPCFTSVAPGGGPSPKDPWGIANQKACLVMGGPWNCNGRVQVHPRQYVINKVLLCCGKDPASTTAAEMDMQDPRLVCYECTSRDSEEMELMSWRCAVHHHLASHPDSTLEHPWYMASQPPVYRSMSWVLKTFPSTSGYALRDYSVCLLCPPRIPSWDSRFNNGNLMGHIKNQHAVSTPVFGKHYTFDRNITPVYFNCVITR